MARRWLLLLFILTLLPASYASVITFSDACTPGKSITIAAVGDVLLHGPLQRKGFAQGFQSLWAQATPYLHACQFAYANLEGPMADGVTRSGQVITPTCHYYDNNIYSSFPVFNYHSNLANALKQSGITIVSTANNHALDRFSIGIDKTIQALDRSGLAYTGTKSRHGEGRWLNILERGGIRIGWIACTALLNGQVDKYNQVLHCHHDRQTILNIISENKNKVDAIIVTPHWGEEYHTKPSGLQSYFAHQVLEAGALVVIGSHPHVLQPMEKYITRDHRQTLIMYSMGNFVSYQGTLLTRSTIMLFLGLTKTANGTVINGVSYLPLYMQNRSGIDRISLMPIFDRRTLPYQVITNILPSGNVLSSSQISTHAQCP